MHLDLTTLALQLINFLVLVLLLRRFLFKPVLGAIDRREAEQTAQRRQAEALAAEAASARDAAVSERASLAAEADSLRAEARQAADADRRRMLDAARQAADGLRQAAAERMEAERRQAETALTAQAGDLAVEIAARLLSDMRPDVADRVLAETLRQELTEQTAETRGLLLAGDGPLLLTTARDWPPDLRRMLEAALPEGRTAWRVDPDLIAGVELTASHHQIRYSWQSALVAARDGLRA